MKDSKIEWTNHTWNPWRGCRKISAGCKHCYMYRELHHYGHNPRQIVRSRTTFTDPLRWTDPAFVFTCSWSDFFIEDADAWRTDAWTIIRQTPHLVFQILTKRPENILRRLPRDWGQGWDNVWLGVSAENQHQADTRIPALLTVPARLRFVSAEPLLGPIIFKPYFWSIESGEMGPYLSPGIDWIIVGGESGPHQGHPKYARPMEMAWARAIRDQCVRANVPFFFKQDWGVLPGERAYIVEEDGSQTIYRQMPDYTGQVPPQQEAMF